MSPGVRRGAVVGSLIALAATVVTVVALAQDSGDTVLSVRLAAEAPAQSTATKPSGPSYCETARAALQYQGSDRAELAKLLTRVVEAAPAEVASTVRRVRATQPGTRGYARAKHLWDYYNNSHCCQCIGGRRAPEISELTPEQRARVEAGKSISET